MGLLLVGSGGLVALFLSPVVPGAVTSYTRVRTGYKYVVTSYRRSLTSYVEAAPVSAGS